MNHPTCSTTHHIYQRTTKGHAAAVSGAQTDLSAEQRRLLLLVNGFTPMKTFADMASFDAQPEAVADALKASGLIEEAAAPAKRQPFAALDCH